MLWEKESNGELYINILNTLDSSVAGMLGLNSNLNQVGQPKSNARAKMHRFKGNEKVNELEWHEAMELYNKCLCSAEKGSENISLAYANRSLCFLKLKMYEKCLIDIDLAIKADYPKQKIDKLYQRRALCLKKLEENPIKSDEPKLDFKEHELFPGMANVLNMEYNREFGRHIVATSNIEVGKVVLVEEAFVTTPVMSTEKMACSKCFKEKMNFIACEGCIDSMYCSRECKKRDEFHDLTCGKKNKNPNHLVSFVARSIALAVDRVPRFQYLIDFVESVLKDKKKCTPTSLADDQSKYRAFLKLSVNLSEEEKVQLYDTGFHIHIILMSYYVVKDKLRNEKDERFLMHLILHHLYIIKCNSFQYKSCGGVFLIQKHFNHSCAPNLLQYFTANKTICFASRSIKKGDQVFVTYGNAEFWLEPTFIRQEVLLKNYNFKCNCEKCFGFGKKRAPDDLTCLTGQTSLELKVEKEFQYLRNEMKEIDFTDKAKCSKLKKNCLSLLKKYHAMPWASELDIICNAFVKLLNETN